MMQYSSLVNSGQVLRKDEPSASALKKMPKTQKNSSVDLIVEPLKHSLQPKMQIIPPVKKEKLLNMDLGGLPYVVNQSPTLQFNRNHNVHILSRNEQRPSNLGITNSRNDLSQITLSSSQKRSANHVTRGLLSNRSLEVALKYQANEDQRKQVSSQLQLIPMKNVEFEQKPQPEQQKKELLQNSQCFNTESTPEMGGIISNQNQVAGLGTKALPAFKAQQQRLLLMKNRAYVNQRKLFSTGSNSSSQERRIRPNSKDKSTQPLLKSTMQIRQEIQEKANLQDFQNDIENLVQNGIKGENNNTRKTVYRKIGSNFDLQDQNSRIKNAICPKKPLAHIQPYQITKLQQINKKTQQLVFPQLENISQREHINQQQYHNDHQRQMKKIKKVPSPGKSTRAINLQLYGSNHQSQVLLSPQPSSINIQPLASRRITSPVAVTGQSLTQNQMYEMMSSEESILKREMHDMSQSILKSQDFLAQCSLNINPVDALMNGIIQSNPRNRKEKQKDNKQFMSFNYIVPKGPQFLKIEEDRLFQCKINPQSPFQDSQSSKENSPNAQIVTKMGRIRIGKPSSGSNSPASSALDQTDYFYNERNRKNVDLNQ